MAVMTPREKWTDEKLDDLNKKVDDGFAETKAETREGFARVEGEIKRLDGDIKRLDESVGHIDSNVKRLDGNVSELGREMNARFEGLYRTLQACTVAVIVALIGSNAL